MGVVYRAIDPDSDRPVAIKVMAPYIASDTAAAARFHREATATAGLRHPNIAAVCASGQHERQPYIVFEWIDGRPLNEILDADGRLPLDRALRLIEPVARALDYAHEHGILHRDIKPANILITPDDTPVIIDFGLAWLAGGTALTVTGMMFGTPRYMAPEQFQGATIDGRADLYSLAVTFYEMLAGRPPFDDDSFHALYHKHMFVAPPAITTFSPYLPDSLAAVLERALAKQPDERYPTGAALYSALWAAASQAPPYDENASTVQLPALAPTPDAPQALAPASAQEARRTNAQPLWLVWSALGAAVGLFFLFAFTATSFLRPTPTQPPTRFVVVTSIPSPAVGGINLINEATRTPEAHSTGIPSTDTSGPQIASTETQPPPSAGPPATFVLPITNSPTLASGFATGVPTHTPSPQASPTVSGPTPLAGGSALTATSTPPSPSTLTPTRYGSPTRTDTAPPETATRTASPAPTFTRTASATRTSTPTRTATATPMPSHTWTPTATSTPAPTSTPATLGSILSGPLYLHNYPSPPSGDTSAQASLPMDAIAASSEALFNYDTNRDGEAGLLIQKGGAGFGESDPTKHQRWRSEVFLAPASLTGAPQLVFWSGLKNFKHGKYGAVAAYLAATNGTTVAWSVSGSVQRANWQRGSASWVESSLAFGALGPGSIPAGYWLELVLVVDDISDDDMWFAYDTAAYPSRVIWP
jgi:serine/threonine-protein kinase